MSNVTGNTKIQLCFTAVNLISKGPSVEDPISCVLLPICNIKGVVRIHDLRTPHLMYLQIL